MTTLLLKNPRSYKGTLAVTAALCVIFLGIFFRFYRIDYRLFWQDEVYVVYRTAGYTEYDLKREMPNGKVHSFKALEKYLHPATNNKGLSAVIKTAWEFPHIPPLYESLLWYWVQLFGDSIAAIRSFSAFLSLFAFPLVIWLCWELFRSYKAGWIAAALIAVSPYQVIYSQEARNYSIWCVTILLSTAALLRALRLKNLRAWALYAVSAAFGLYSHLFFIYVAVAQASYVLLRERTSIKKFALSTLGVAVLFSPQLLLIFLFFERAVLAQKWIGDPVPGEALLQTFLAGLSSLFFEQGATLYFLDRLIPQPIFEPLSRNILYVMPLLSVLFFIFLLKKADRNSFLLILLIGSVNFLSLLIPDLLMGGTRICNIRYQMPFFLMIQLSGAFFIYSCMKSQSFARRAAGRLLLSGLLIFGAVSCLQNSHAPALSYSGSEYRYKELAGYLDAHPGSLVIRVVKLWKSRNFFTTSYYLKYPEKSFAEELPLEEPFSIDFDLYNKKLLTFSDRTISEELLHKWVGASGEYKLVPVGPKYWQEGKKRIYEIERV